MDLQAIVDGAFADAETYRGLGQVATYVPALADVNPRKLGIAVALGDGTTYAAGDADEPFSIQSIATIFTLGLALRRAGGAIWNRVGREPSGSPANMLALLEAEKGKPRNPLMNVGAMVAIDALMADEGPDICFAYILGFMKERAGDDGIAVDQNVAMSESQAGALNRSIAYFVSAFGNLTNPVEDVLSVYFRQCAIAMSCRQLARAALYLAFDGNDPLSGDAIVTPSRARHINALMLAAGHYDNNGDFAFRVGLPGKSGIGGGIVATVPGKGAVAVWSPGLNSGGSSLAGTIALEKLVERTDWSIFA